MNIKEEQKEDKPLDKASVMVSAIENKDDDLQNSFEVCSPDPQENDKKEDEIIEDMPLQIPPKKEEPKPISDSTILKRCKPKLTRMLRSS